MDFDYSSWVEEFGAGTVYALAIRAKDEAPYPISLEEVDENKVGWVLSDSDTQYSGLLKAQYIYMVDEQIAKTVIYCFIVEPSLDEVGAEPPPPYESWVNDVLEAAQEVMQAIASGGYAFYDDGQGNITIQQITTSEVENNG